MLNYYLHSDIQSHRYIHHDIQIDVHRSGTVTITTNKGPRRSTVLQYNAMIYNILSSLNNYIFELQLVLSNVDVYQGHLFSDREMAIQSFIL
jgi:hypothetical protein